MTKPLPTLYLSTRAIESADRPSDRLHAYLHAYLLPVDDCAGYVPASSLAALTAENAALRAEVERLRDVIAEAHDDLLDLPLNDGGVRQCRAIRDALTAALTPAKET